VAASEATRAASARPARWVGLSPDRAVVWAVVLTSWALAALAAVADGGRLLSHDALLERSGLPWPVALVLFLAVWQVMIGAMMLPTSLPMVWLFARASRGQPHRRLAVAAFLAAYAAIWTGFAVVAFVGDTALHELVARWDGLRERPWLIFGVALLGAGAFQFSPLKERCLHECRHPLAFLIPHYRRGLGAAWGLGLRHGLFCLGCCWALMLMMFAVGAGNLAWMAVLTGVMLLEKTSRRGQRLVPLVGATLLAIGSAVVLRGLVQP
jgi:predicted metal-binding membrane protein